jgi:hypothetical protein
VLVNERRKLTRNKEVDKNANNVALSQRQNSISPDPMKKTPPYADVMKRRRQNANV